MGDTEVKRHLLFGGPDFYPGGGMGDFVGDFDSDAEAKEAADERMSFKDPDDHGKHDWQQVLDSQTGEWVERRGEYSPDEYEVTRWERGVS